MFYKKTFCNLGTWGLENKALRILEIFHTIHTIISFLSRGAPSKLGESTEESGGFLRGKSDFTRRKVGDHEKPTKRPL